MNSQQQEIIMPPAPPVVEIIHPTTQNANAIPTSPLVVKEESFIPGEFDYAYKFDRLYLKDAYQVISRNELWEPFRKALLYRGVDTFTGFQFTKDPLYLKIMDAIASTPIGTGHSGCSIGYTMRAMEIIALLGEAEYRRQCIIYEAEKQKNQRRQEDL